MAEFNFQTSVIERLSRLLMTGLHSDVEFLLRDSDGQKKMKGHKLLFAISSPVFEAMMYGDLADIGVIPIEDIKPSAFETMMKYIYTDDIQLSSVEHATDVYQVADKYNLPQLEKVAEEYILSNVKADVACEVLEFSKLFDKSDIEKACMQLIKKNTSDVFKSKGFVECSLETLQIIVNEDVLNVSEIDLFNAVEEWAIYNAEKLEKPVELVISSMDNIISKIRFLSMTPDEFIKGPCKSKFLTFEERYNLLTNLNVPGNAPLPERVSSISRPRNRDCPQLLFSLQNYYKDGTNVRVVVTWLRKNISKIEINKEYFSPEFYLNDKPFKIKFGACPMFSGDVVYLRFHLQCTCNNITHGPDWSCSVDYSFKLVSQKEGQPDYILSSSHKFTNGCDRGWFQFLKWSEVIDPERGLVKDDSLLLVSDLKLKDCEDKKILKIR